MLPLTPRDDPRWRRRKFMYVLALALFIGLMSMIAAARHVGWLLWLGVPSSIALSSYALFMRAALRPRARRSW